MKGGVRFMKKRNILAIGALCLLAVFIIAAKPSGITHLTSLWVGDATDTGDVTPGDNDLFVSGTMECDGAARFDGATTFTSTVTLTARTKYLELPMAAFVVNSSATWPTNGIAPLSASTIPGYEYDDSILGVVWADGETTPIEQTFVVPNDYVSGGAFEAFFTRSGVADPPSVDHEVWINRNAYARDVSATNQSATELNYMYSSSPQEVALSVTTDFATLAVGDRVTFKMWRDDTDTSPDDLELKGAVLFTYTGRY